jgi:excisionase family DNA binding protein
MTPRCLTKDQAAKYCGLKVSGFDEWVKSGRVPGPMPGTQRYDRHAIDKALDRASGFKVDTGDPYEDWKNSRKAAG